MNYHLFTQFAGCHQYVHRRIEDPPGCHQYVHRRIEDPQGYHQYVHRRIEDPPGYQDTGPQAVSSIQVPQESQNANFNVIDHDADNHSPPQPNDQMMNLV
jgi:hypothetical protein